MVEQENKFCSLSDLTNEATVETRIVDPLLDDLGYPYQDIRLKTSISELAVGKGHKKVLYKPDYVLTTDGVPTIVLDAKSPKESLETWESQCSSYCLEINRLFDYNPVTQFVLTNGIETRVYKWDKKKAILILSFSDLVDSSHTFLCLHKLLSRESTKHSAKSAKEEIDKQDFDLKEITLDELQDKFQRMHRIIWQSEKKGPSAAFEELMKIVFVKIEKDRQLRKILGKGSKPKYRDVIFSTHWVVSQTESDSPINEPLFTNIVKALEADIATGKRKRIFDSNEELELSPETIRKIVKEIEHVDFFAMEEDIHGRMFETFLDATVRGKDIGQFFTPREIVDLMVQLANPTVKKDHIDSVLDACCGSGGFLISSMRSMLAKVDKLKGLSSGKKETLQRKIINNSLYGIDAGSDPAMYRIARMNMFLHGDGGSHIYYADSLDKKIGKVGKSSVENDQQLDEVRKLILDKETRFDIILSNPPFSLQYSRDDSSQAEILSQYELSIDRVKGRVFNKLPSSVMFLERYRDLIRPKGKILAIIDESILSGTSYGYVRDYLRVRPETLCRITEFSEHESNGRELDEGERVAVEVLPVLGQSAAAVEPGDGAFDHPTPGLDDEALHPIGSLDDLGLEIGQDAGQGAVKDRALIGAVGEQFPEKGKQTKQGRQQRETAVAILNVGGGDDAVQQQALRIDQNMPLLALDQLAGIEAVAVDASPPFSALFTL